MAENLAIVDVETTGFGPGDRILEIAVVEVADDEITSEWSTLVNPLIPFQRGVSGIEAADVAGAAPFKAIAAEVHRHIDGRTVVGHKIDFDMRFLDRELADAGAKPLRTVGTMDTMHMSGDPALRRRRLEDLAEQLGVTTDGEHRALADARTAAKCYLALHQESDYSVQDLINGEWVTRSDLKPFEIAMIREIRMKDQRRAALLGRTA